MFKLACAGLTALLPHRVRHTLTHSLTDFGFFGVWGEARRAKRGRKESENRDLSRVPTAEWRTGTRYRFLRRCGPNWPSWSWSYRRVSTWISPLSSAALPRLCCCCCSGGCEARCRFGLLPRGRTGSEFELRGGKVWSSNCHKFKSICPHSLSTQTHAAILAALVYLAVIWMQGMWCFGGVAVRRKQTRHYSILMIFSWCVIEDYCMKLYKWRWKISKEKYTLNNIWAPQSHRNIDYKRYNK